MPPCSLTRNTVLLEVLFGRTARGGIPRALHRNGFSACEPFSLYRNDWHVSSTSSPVSIPSSDLREKLTRSDRFFFIIMPNHPIVKRFLRFSGRFFSVGSSILHARCRQNKNVSRARPKQRARKFVRRRPRRHRIVHDHDLFILERLAVGHMKTTR